MVYKIHPGIGVARVGDSPSDWYIGPETWPEPDPPYGGYRDAEGRIKRQAGRFRVFDHSGSVPVPVDDADVTWTVVLGPSSTGPSATLLGPNKVQTLATTPLGGSSSLVSWGEIRTDSEGHLLVLSGIVGGTFDGAGCGKISAEIGGMQALSAWIIIVAPGWAPYRRPSRSMYDFLLDLAGAPLPSPLLFVRDIYPILRGFEIGDGNLPMGSTAEHTLASSLPVGAPGQQSYCVQRLITPRQSQIVTAWINGTFDATSWPSSPPPPMPSLADPAELDRGPLSRLGAGGYEAWGQTAFLPFLDPADPLRLSFAAPNQYPVSFSGTSGWPGDDCHMEWPEIWDTPGTPSGNLHYEPDLWQRRGFVVRQGGSTVYVQDNPGAQSLAYVMQLTRELDFGNVRVGQTETAALVFEIAYEAAGVTFTLTLPSWLTGPSTYSVPAQGSSDVTTEYIPISYDAGVPGPPLSGTIVVQQGSGGPTFSIPVRATPVAAVPTEVVFALDYSSSMNDLCADNMTKITKLRDALDTFLLLARTTDGVGAAAFSTGALAPLAVSPVASSTLHAYALASPAGSTSIGAGINSAVGLLNAAAASYSESALIVVTDGMENTAPLINDAVGGIPDATRVFSIGVGRPQDVNTSTLQALCGNQGGYLLLTGSLDSSVEAMLLEKYFLRILGNATNLETLLDPEIVLEAGRIERIPFLVTEFDRSFDAILLSREREFIGFALEAPDGSLVTPATLEGFPGNHYKTGNNTVYYRVRLPLPLGNAPLVQAGTWHILLTLRRPETHLISEELTHTFLREPQTRAPSPAQSKQVRCQTIVHAESDLRFTATAQQLDLAPGSPVLLEAQLSLRAKPFTGKTGVTAHVQGPANMTTVIALSPEGSGRFTGKLEPIRPGLYSITIAAQGVTPKAHQFRREHFATAAVIDGRTGMGGAGCGCGPCSFLSCLLARHPEWEWIERFRALGLAVKAFAECCNPHAKNAARERGPKG